MKMKVVLQHLCLILTIPSALASSCSAGRHEVMVGLKQSKDGKAYKKTLSRSLGGGAQTSVTAYDSSTIEPSGKTLAVYGIDNEVRRDELFSTATTVMEMDPNGFIGLGYRLRTSKEVSKYLKKKKKARDRRNKNKKFRKLGQRRNYNEEGFEDKAESNEMRKEHRRLRRAERKAERALFGVTTANADDTRRLAGQVDEITGSAVIRYDFGCQEFHKLTIGVASLFEGETVVYKAFRDGQWVSEGSVTGNSSGDLEFVIEPGQLFDTLEFSAGPSSSFLISYVLFCQPSTCEGARAGWYGDPHLNTFDNLRWSCMGWGHFMMFEGIKGNGKPNTEVQVIFDKMPWITRKMTSTRAVVIDAGEPDTPVLQFSALRMPEEDENCGFKFLVNEVEQDLDLWVDSNDKAIITSKGMSIECGNQERMRSRGGRVTINYPDIGFEIAVWSTKSSENGCIIASSICLDDYWDDKEVRGLMGDNDGDKSNDWIDKDGDEIPGGVNMKELKTHAAYDYCINYWCLNKDESKFVYPFEGEDWETYDHCDPIYVEEEIDILKEVEDDPATNNAMDLCLQAAEDDSDKEDCYIEIGIMIEAGDGEGGSNEAAENFIDDHIANQEAAEPEGFVETDPEDEPVDNFSSTLYNAGNVKGRRNGPEATPAALGDPHFKLWNGEMYDFHGICDLVLLQNRNFRDYLGIEIQIRTKKTRQWSFISNAVVRIGDETFEVAGARKENQYWINGVEGDKIEYRGVDGALMKLKNDISGYSILFRELHSQQKEYVVDLHGGEKVKFTTWKDMIRVEVLHGSEENFGESVGLMGSFKDSKKLGRDNVSVITDLMHFGQEWQVQANEDNLFHIIEGPQAPDKCEIPSKSVLRRNLAESKITLEEAHKACSGVTNKDEFDLCVFDVMASSDVGVAGAY